MIKQSQGMISLQNTSVIKKKYLPSVLIKESEQIYSKNCISFSFNFSVGSH